MPTNTLRENLHLCFAKLTRNSTIKKISSSSSTSSITTSNSATQLTKSPSHQTEAVLFKNFNSLYNSNHSEPAQAQQFNSTSSSSNLLSSSSSSFSSSEHDPAVVDDVYDGRFFFSSPGRSKSIVDDEAMPVVVSDDGDGNGIFAIPTYSQDPHADFRRSMEEMVLAQGLRDARALWDYLHALLLCYLALNRKSTHRFILGAFNDLLLSLLGDGDGSPAHPRLSN